MPAMTAQMVFTGAERAPSGTRAAAVAKILERLVEAEGEPLTLDELMRGMSHSQQYIPALHALELVGAVERWTYRNRGKTKLQFAYSLAEGVEVVE